MATRPSSLLSLVVRSARLGGTFSLVLSVLCGAAVGSSRAQSVFAEADALVDTVALPVGGVGVLDDLVIEGNRKTRRSYILRELGIAPGDTLSFALLRTVFAQARRRLLNTGLFNEASLRVTSYDTLGGGLTLGVRVREKWYAYPQVNFDLADRNFNIWWEEQDASLERVNYGLKLSHANFTGRADKLTFQVQRGYTRRFELGYTVPFVDREGLVGLEFGALVERNREWWSRTDDGQLKFYRVDTANVLSRRRFTGGVTLRPGLYATHRMRLERHSNHVDSALAKGVNRDFFGGGRESQRYWALAYEFTWDRRDVRPYPLRGHLLGFTVDKLGLAAGDDLNRLNVSLRYTYYRPLFGPVYAAFNVKVKTDLVRTPVPYFNRDALGFGNDFLRGYQYYVIDGLDYAYLRNTLRVRALRNELRMSWLPVRRYRTIPYRVFLTAHGDLGGVHDPYKTPGNTLANRVLGSYGVGADVVIFYGTSIHFELTHNEFGEWGGYFGYAVGL